MGGALLAMGLCAPSQVEAKRRPRDKKPAAAAEAAPQSTAEGTADADPGAEPSEPSDRASGDQAPPNGDAPAGGQVQLSPEEADRLAREHFEKGRSDYDEGKYREAWDHFHQAYGLSDRPELLYNIGQTADRLGRSSDALSAFRLYLERNPDAENRREVENRIRALEDRVKQEQASGSQQGATDDPSAPAAPPRPQPLREGFYLRMGLGLGFMANARTTSATTTLAGASTASELWFGHSVTHGLALGGGLYFDIAFKVTGTAEGTNAEVEDGPLRLMMFGGGADWYPWPSRNGVHFQAALALARLSSDGLSSGSPTGGGGLLGGGYEWPIAREWSLGVLGRLALAGLEDDGVTHTVLAASAQVSATWF